MTPVEENTVPVQVVEEEPAPPKPRKKPGPKPGSKKKPAKDAAPRAMAVVDLLEPKKMTDTEKNQYIEELRKINNTMREQLKNLSETCGRLGARTREAEEKYENLKAQVNHDMNLIRSAATLMMESIINHTQGGR